MKSSKPTKVLVVVIVALISSLSPDCAALVHYQQQQQNAFLSNHNNQMQQQQQDHLMQSQPQAQLQLQQPLQQQSAPIQQPPQLDPQNDITHRNSDRNGPIFRCHGMALNSTAIKLVWSLRNDKYADYFDIEWGPIPDATHVFSVSKLNGTARDYTFHNLEPDKLYHFQLYGYHGDHIYTPQLVAVRTPPANQQQKSNQDSINKDIMPLGVKAEAKSNSTIQLTWTEPEKPANLRNTIRVNKIRYYINSSPQTAAANNDSSATQQLPTAPQYHYLNVTNLHSGNVTVQKLRPATEYAFAVKTLYLSPDSKKLYTQSGYSMDTIAKTFDLEPSPPRNFSIQPLAPTKEESLTGLAGKLELSWSPPESPNGQLKGYVILYAHDQQTADDQWIRIDVNGPNINNWYVANLRPGWSYFFKIRAINQRGQSSDSETRLYVAPSTPPEKVINMPVPPNNVLLLIVICMVAILFLLFLIVSRLACRTRRKPRKGSLNTNSQNNQKNGQATNNSTASIGAPKLNGFASNNSSSTVTARVGTLARRRDNSSNKPDFWINAMDQQQDAKSNVSEKSNGDVNMAMVSIQRDSPQFATTQLASALPEYRYATGSAQTADQQLLQQLQPQSHYHLGQYPGNLAYDQMDNATASALMTLSKRQQQQMQRYQIQFASTAGNQQVPLSVATSMGIQQTQAPSPHQQPPPPPPLNIEQQQQPLYGTHQSLVGTRSLRFRPTYDPVSCSFVQNGDTGGPPNYNSHQMHTLAGSPGQNMIASQFGSAASNTLQFHPHQTSTLMSRRSTNTLRSFQTGGTYGQLAGFGNNATTVVSSSSHFGQPLPPPPVSSLSGNQQPQQLLQSHQAVINQLNNSTYPSLPLKHVSTVRPQRLSSLEDQIEMEFAEKEQQQSDQQLQQQQPQTIKQ